MSAGHDWPNIAEVRFHSDPFTVRELQLMQRIKRDVEDLDAMVMLLASRSRMSVDFFLDMRVTDLEPPVEAFGESLQQAVTLMHLANAWKSPTITQAITQALPSEEDVSGD